MMGKDQVSIDFSFNKLKIVCVKGPPNKREITNVIVKDIRNLSDNDIATAIKASFKEIKVKNHKVIAVIPSHLAMTKNIEIPSLDYKEIQEIINLQSGRYTPYAREEIIIDYIDIGIYRQSYTKVLLVIVPQKVIKRYLEIINQADLEIERISIASEGICRIHSYLAKVKTEDTPISVVHIGDDSTDFTVALGNKMIFVRNMPLGVHYFLNEKEKFKERFIEEVKRSLESYQSEDIDRTPTKILLTAAVEEIQEIKAILDNTLHIPTAVVPYVERLPFKKDALNLIHTVKHTSFLEVLAPFFISDQLSIDLVPKEIKLRRALEVRGKEIIKMGILIMAVFVLICGILASKIYFKSQYLDNLTTKYQSTNREAEALEEDFSRVQIIRNYLSTRGYSLEVLNELYKLIAVDVYLNNIRFGEEGEFSIKGTSESMSTVFALVSEMEQSEYFQNVKTKYTTKRKEENKDLTDFQITCSLEGVR